MQSAGISSVIIFAGFLGMFCVYVILKQGCIFSILLLICTPILENFMKMMPIF